MYFDGSVMKTGADAGLLFISPLGEHMRYVIRLHFPASNNMAEYEALLSGLRIAIELDVRGDSQLVIDQVMKESSCHDPKMEAYYSVVRRLVDKFNGLELNHVPCNYNNDADELAKIASGRTTVPTNIFARDNAKPSVDFKDLAQPGPSNAEPPGGNPRRTRPRPWTLTSRPPPWTRPKQWRSTMLDFRKTGVTSTSTGLTEECYPQTAHRRDTSLGEPSLSS
jgi:ribonuclease HI